MTLHNIMISDFRKKPRSRPHSFPALLQVQTYLQMLQKPLTFTELFTEGPIRHKYSYINYLHYLLDHGFIGKRKEYYTVRILGVNVKNRKKPTRNPNVFYFITEKGEKLLELLG